MKNKTKYTTRAVLSFLLLIIVSCDSSGLIGITEVDSSIEELISNIDKGSNRVRCESLLSLYPYGKSAIPYLIERIDEPRGESFGLKNTNITITKRGESLIHEKPLGVLYAYMVNFILIKNNLKGISCSDNQTEILPKGNVTFVSPYGMINKAEEKSWKRGRRSVSSTISFNTLSSEDMIEIKTQYNKWWFENKRHEIDRLRVNYMRNISSPLGRSLYYWY